MDVYDYLRFTHTVCINLGSNKVIKNNVYHLTQRDYKLMEQRSSSNRWKWGIVTSLVLAVAYIAAVPYINVYQLKQATDNKDAETFSERVDFVAVRQSLKEQFNAKMLADTIVQEQNSFAAFGALLAGTLVDRMLEAYVTPSGVEQLFKGEKPNTSSQNPNSSPDTSSNQPAHKKESTDDASYSMGYIGLDKFAVEITDKKGQVTTFILRRDLINFKVVGIKLPLN